MSLVHRAALFAAERHSGHNRDGQIPIPYIAHPLDVLNTLVYTGCIADEELHCVALLHDTLEDTNTTPEEIQSLFGTRVAQIVQELTRIEPTTEETAGLSEEEIYALRNRLFFEEIRAMSPEAQTIKLCDRISNLREARVSRPPRKLARYARQTFEILDIIPESVNPKLWRRVQKLAAKALKQAEDQLS